MAEYPGALDMFVDYGRVFVGANPGSCIGGPSIVIHKTAGFSTIEELGQYFATTPEETSSHFGVGLDGRIAQFVHLGDGAAANCCVDAGNYDSYWNSYLGNYKNLNMCTFSIEHIDPRTDNGSACPAAQKDASFKLIVWLMDRYKIPFSRVKGHFSIAGKNRANCPGNYPWSELQAFVEAGVSRIINIEDVSGYFTENKTNGMWTCRQNGYIIGNAILREYRERGGRYLCGLTALGLPLSNEIGIAGIGAYQKFERGILVYDPGFKYDWPAGHDRANAVYAAHLDTGVGLNAYGVSHVPDSIGVRLNALAGGLQSIRTDLGFK